jgi:DNA-binding HxlR family transcriptional regulator
MKKECTSNTCAVLNTLQLIGNKWVLAILVSLLEGTKRFGDLGRELEQISPKMLTQQLRKMEKDGLVTRKVYAEVPPKVEYSLTEKGRALAPVLNKVLEWGEKYN